MRYKHRISIFFILFFITLSEGISSDIVHFKYYLYVDFSNGSACDISYIKYFASVVKDEGLSDNFAIVIKTKKLKEFERFTKQHQFDNIINDTAGQITKFISKLRSSAFLVINSENRLSFLKEDIKKNPVDFDEIRSKFREIDVSKCESIKFDESQTSLDRPSAPILSQKKDKFVVLDRLDESVKEYEVSTGKLIRKIEVDSSLMYHFIKDSLYYYQSTIPPNTSLETKFKRVNYDKDDNILISAQAFKGLIAKRINRKNITLKYQMNGNYDLAKLSDSIWIEELITVDNSYLCLLQSNPKFDVLNDGKHYLAALLDPNDFHTKQNLISYQDIFKYYNKSNFVYSIGLLSVLDESSYVYLNPWNGFFFKFNENIQDSLQIMGYLNLIRSADDTKLIKMESRHGYVYKIMNLTTYNNEVLVYLNAFDIENQISFSVLQIYEVQGSLKREIILNSSNEQYFRSYVLNIENDFIYLFNQDEEENWSIIKIPNSSIF